MGGPVAVKNAADTWVNQNAAARNYNQKSRLFIRTSGGDNKYAWLYFNKPWPSGATIISAKLRIYSADAWGGSTTVTVLRAASKWSVNKINYNNQPATTGAAATVTQSGTSAGEMYEIDVTAHVQAVANGAPWYGFRVSTNRATNSSFHSAQSPQGNKRPVLVVTWSDAPDQADGLSPAGGRSVGIALPMLTWEFSDVSGDQNHASVQVQVGASEALLNAGTVTWDSGVVSSTVPQLDTATAVGFPAPAAGATTWWRARSFDGAGLASPWSAAVSWVRTAKGVLTMTSPAAPASNFLWEGSPLVSWTFTGQTQKSYQVAIALTSDPDNWLWDSGKVTSTDTSVTIPFGVIKDASLSYRIMIRVWDTIAREATPGDTVYVEVTRDATVNYDNAVAPVTSLAAVSDSVWPIEHITFSRSVAPDYFQLQRSEDGGATWYYIDEALPAEITAGGTNYLWDDVGPAPYVAYSWRVVAIVGNKQSGTNPTVSGQVRRLAPFLMRKDGSDAVCFINPMRDRKFLDLQELHERLDGVPVLVTQLLGGSAGHVKGRFVDNQPDGVTAKQMKKRFLSMRKDSGQRMKLAIADETIDVIAYNFQIDTLTDASGLTYAAEFDWVEAPA